MSELLDWFKRRVKRKTFKILNNHLKATMRAIEGLMEVIGAMVQGNLNGVPAIIDRIEKAEEEADSLRRKLMEELAGEKLSLIDREDLMHLVKRVDMVADWCRESARVLRVIYKRSFPNGLMKDIESMAKGVEECALALQRAIEVMSESPEKALEKADEVERLEEKVDELHEKARFSMIEEKGIEAGVLILISNLLGSIENVADACEDACDQIRVIVVRSMQMKG